MNWNGPYWLPTDDAQTAVINRLLELQAAEEKPPNRQDVRRLSAMANISLMAASQFLYGRPVSEPTRDAINTWMKGESNDL